MVRHDKREYIIDLANQSFINQEKKIVIFVLNQTVSFVKDQQN